MHEIDTMTLQPGPPPGIRFRIRKIGHVVLRARDLDKSVKFYTRVLGFHVSGVYPAKMAPVLQDPSLLESKP